MRRLFLCISLLYNIHPFIKEILLHHFLLLCAPLRAGLVLGGAGRELPLSLSPGRDLLHIRDAAGTAYGSSGLWPE